MRVWSFFGAGSIEGRIKEEVESENNRVNRFGRLGPIAPLEEEVEQKLLEFIEKWFLCSNCSEPFSSPTNKGQWICGSEAHKEYEKLAVK